MEVPSSKRISKQTVVFTEYLASVKKKVKIVVPTVQKINLKRLHLENEVIEGNEKKGKVSRWKVYDRQILSSLAVLRENPCEQLTEDRRTQIIGAQTNILNTFNLMSKENVNHISFPKICVLKR